MILKLIQSLIALWATLFLYYSNLPWGWVRLLLALAFLAFAIWSVWIARKPKMNLIFLGAFLVVLAWFISIKPSADRLWRPTVAVMPRAYIDGDRVRITGVRNFIFHESENDFTPRYEEREFLMSHVKSVDLFIAYWKIGPVAHTFVSFNFDDGTPPLCISIETRPEVDKGYSPIGSMFKQYELIYVVGDEHDLVTLRTHIRGDEVFLYPIRASPEGVRQLLQIYLKRINELADHPEFYHLLSSSCTINIVRYKSAVVGKRNFDLRQLLNGWVDRYLYDINLLNTSIPFSELRRQSRITDISNAAEGAPDFSKRIRAELPRGDSR